MIQRSVLWDRSCLLWTLVKTVSLSRHPECNMEWVSSKLSQGLSAILISELREGRDAVICPFVFEDLCWYATDNVAPSLMQRSLQDDKAGSIFQFPGFMCLAKWFTFPCSAACNNVSTVIHCHAPWTIHMDQLLRDTILQRVRLRAFIALSIHSGCERGYRFFNRNRWNTFSNGCIPCVWDLLICFQKQRLSRPLSFPRICFIIIGYKMRN